MKANKLTKETILNVGTEDRGFPNFQVGDTIVVHQRCKEGDKERIQLFEGDVIAYRSKGISSTFTVRKIGANAVAVEKIFPYYSPMIKAIDFVRRGDVRRAKLYFMRDRIGKAARVKEKVMTKVQKAAEMKKVAEKTIK
ncbi:MAG: 50S ribosomal protein L19 [candidate division TM6 bacterium GW2011_GWF2_32_72]|nr:MAG: 50S ribosomal protein L19 [candidate division TM6 bacterium GW2011_GWF2_32_72]